ncbi:alpha/beta fold hydrolase (macronuclear) [Tetrahymena thermophila SB210]|uniref:Alpha/beta fold hydrolase n=1 Tax=Tetrahymena thermophila (strain SB210) TaxID=312017 RepID=I7M2Y6_TETTS|nr:alpha/beta fold hydrolase [Tetrahymena thermophila SB210]EAS01633.1 alpha/beta fold hydrolase [Tetrahymena thermophila SB210]|eukprot:XP_001021878.1 alpha/beta fold hydrolase [Tetrahymena thermophila SB210]
MMDQKVDSGEILSYRKYTAISSVNNPKNILLIHGNFCGQRNWDPFLKYLKEYNVYTLDLRGFGKSTYNHQIESLFDFAKDVVSFCEKQNLNKIQIIGWSLGGAVAMSVALLQPTLIETMILMASVNLQGFPFMSKAGRVKDVIEIKKRLQKIGNLLTRENQQFVFENIIQDRILPKNNQCEEGFLDIIFDQLFSQRNYVDATAYLGIWDISDRCQDIKCPILIYHGTEDIVITYDNAVYNYQTLAKYNPKTYLFTLDGGSHAPVYEVPQQMYQIFDYFIKNHKINQINSRL